MGKSISFWPAVALRGFLHLTGVAVSLAKLFFSASIRSSTLFALRTRLGANVLPRRLALMRSASAAS